jgi:hypothetical protein
MENLVIIPADLNLLSDEKLVSLSTYEMDP